MNDELKLIGSRVRELREVCGISAAEMAEYVQVPEAVYNGYEESGEDIPISTLYRMANHLGVDLTELMTGRSPKLDTYCLVRKGEGVSVSRYPGYQFQSLAHCVYNLAYGLGQCRRNLAFRNNGFAWDAGQKIATFYLHLTFFLFIFWRNGAPYILFDFFGRRFAYQKIFVLADIVDNVGVHLIARDADRVGIHYAAK